MFYTAPSPYVALCDLASDRHCVLKLVRHGSMWGIHIVEPAEENGEYRAAAVLFPRLEMLEAEARHLVRWLAAAADSPESERSSAS